MNPAPTPRPIVVKIGGSTLGRNDTSLEDLVALQSQGTIPVVVHGGGNLISQWMKRSKTLPRFVQGLRVTDEPTLEVVIAVLAGLVNKQIVATLQAMGGTAIGLSGVDGGLLKAEIWSEELGFVGKTVQVHPEPIQQVIQMGYIPVVAPIALQGRHNSAGGGMLNVNGDTVSGALAAALPAERLIFLTDVEGIRSASRALIPRLLPEQAQALIAGGVVSGGMIPKVEACLQALPHVSRTQIVDGRQSHALLRCFTEPTTGTLIW